MYSYSKYKVEESWSRSHFFIFDGVEVGARVYNFQTPGVRAGAGVYFILATPQPWNKHIYICIYIYIYPYDSFSKDLCSPKLPICRYESNYWWKYTIIYNGIYIYITSIEAYWIINSTQDLARPFTRILTHPSYTYI